MPSQMDQVIRLCPFNDTLGISQNIAHERAFPTREGHDLVAERPERLRNVPADQPTRTGQKNAARSDIRA